MNNTASSSVVPEVLVKVNYRKWSVLIRKYLLSQDVWDVIHIQPSDDVWLNNPAEWIRKNDVALHAIQSYCRQDILDSIKDISTAKDSWDLLKKMHDEYKKIHPGMLEDHERTRYLTLLSNIRRHVGNYDALKKLSVRFPDLFDGVIFSGGSTVMHVASAADDLEIVEELFRIVRVDYLNDYMEIQDENGDTALSIAASNGKMRIAECLVQKNHKLLTIRNHDGNIPLVVACLNLQKDMTSYLYSVTPLDFLLPQSSNQGSLFLKHSILNGMAGVGLDLYKRYPPLAASKESLTLLDLSVHESLFRSTTSFSIFDFFVYEVLIFGSLDLDLKVDLPHWDMHLQRQEVLELLGKRELMLLNIKYLAIFAIRRLQSQSRKVMEIYEIKLTHTYAKLVLSYWCTETRSTCWDTTQLVESGAVSAILQAIKRGITEIVVNILDENLELILLDKKLSREILLTVIKYRREDILRFISRLHVGRKALHSFEEDQDGNNLLHLVAKLPYQLDDPNGITFFAFEKFNQELKWFKEFEKVLPSWYKRVKNKVGDTPVQVFQREHKNLRKEAEKWAKNTANSYSIVAALIVTIMFASAFTIPGGNDQSTGFPILLGKKKKLFSAFMVCDVVSFVTASTSLLAFLSILTKSYGQRYFVRRLPSDFIFSIISLIISICTMILAFTFAVIMMLPEEWSYVSVLVVYLTMFPVSLFSLIQIPTFIFFYRMMSPSKIFN